MRPIGFSTGPLPDGGVVALVDRFVKVAAGAVELSARRKKKLAPLVEILGHLDLSSFAHVSIHAPKQFKSPTEAEAARMLSICIERGWPVVVHPDTIVDPAIWSAFGSLLTIENMDGRKDLGRTVEEMADVLARFPRASICLDLAHASHIDPHLRLARRLIEAFGPRLRQIHLSEIDAFGAHLPLRKSSPDYYRAVLRDLPETVAVVLETPVPLECLAGQIDRARECFEPASREVEERDFRRLVEARIRERVRARAISSETLVLPALPGNPGGEP